MPAHQMKVKYVNVRRLVPKSVTIATSLERSQKEGRFDHDHCTYSENLMKIGPVHSDIIGLKGPLKINKANNRRRAVASCRSTGKMLSHHQIYDSNSDRAMPGELNK